MKPRRYLIPLALLLLSACATNQKQDGSLPEDASRPTHVSMYFYSAGSMQLNEGAYDNAFDLFQRAASNDPGSLRIKRQMLLSAMYHYVQQRSDSLAVKNLVDGNRDLIATDRDLLDTSYSYYNELGDREGTRWAVDTMLQNYPSARAHVLNFLHSYSEDPDSDPALLLPALEMARNDAQQLHALSQLLDLVDPPAALEAVKRLYAIDPVSGTADMVASRLVISEDEPGKIDYFNSLRYPEDLELMYLILDEALQIGQLQFINSVSPRVIATRDAELAYLVALSALFSRDHGILASVGTTLDDELPRPEEENYVNSLLIANSLLERDGHDLNPMLDRLTGSIDLDNIVRFYFLAMGSTLQDPSAIMPDSVYTDLAQRIELRLPEGIKKRYLVSTALAIPEVDTTLSSSYNRAREELILGMMRQGYYNPEDINWLLSIYFQSGRMEERVPLLRKGIELFPDQHSWFNDLGYTLLTRGGDPEEAAVLIFEALSMDPSNAFYLDSIAWYYYLKGDFEHARDFISGVMEMENMPSEIAYHIALIHLKLNDFETARSFMGRAASGSDDPVHNEKAWRALQLWGGNTEKP